MAKQAHYGIAPSINLARTLMKTEYDIETSWQHGKLIPLDMIPVIPGSSFKVDLTSYIRMSDPIVPIFGNISVGIHAFFVPWRLVWEHTEEFFGANKTEAGPQKTEYFIPKAYFDGIAPHSVADYLGKPITEGYALNNNGPTNYVANVLKERAYLLIWNEWYRHQQTMNPFLIDITDGDARGSVIGSRNGVDVTTSMMPIEVSKQFDMFTASTLAPQYGDPVTITLGDEAPIVFTPNENYEGVDVEDGVAGPTFRVIADGTPATMSADGDGGLWNGVYYDDAVSYHQVSTLDRGLTDSTQDMLAYDPAGTLKVDLSSVIMTNVRDLRFAFALQRYFEALNFGSRYFEILANVYGTTNPDARLQRPEHIGQIHFPIQVQTVLSTAGAEQGTTSKLGQAGANSVTLNRNVLCSKGFTEFGFLCLMLDTKHERVYSQGLMREDLVSDRFDQYAPQFDHVGDFEVKTDEIVVRDTGLTDEPFGFQEGWYNERYRNSRVSGLLNPNASGVLAPYSLAEVFDVTQGVELNESFMFEDRNNIARVLKTGITGPDYIANFHVRLRMVKPMSAHSLPGLIDHVGRL